MDLDPIRPTARRPSDTDMTTNDCMVISPKLSARLEGLLKAAHPQQSSSSSLTVPSQPMQKRSSSPFRGTPLPVLREESPEAQKK